MRKVIIVLGIVLLLSAMAGAQEWHWNFDPYVSNPSGIQLGRGVYPFLIDIDDDDDLDMMLSDREHGLRMFKNIGTPEQYSFQEITGYFDNVDVDRIVNGELIDFDNDGILEFACGKVDRTYRVYGGLFYFENQGDNLDPVWVQEESIFEDVDSSSSPFFADWDADGDYDLGVLVEGENHISPIPEFYENIGDNIDPVWQVTYEGFDGFRQDGEFWEYSDPQFFDIDDDNDYDLIISGYIPDGLYYTSFFVNHGNPDSAYFSGWGSYGIDVGGTDNPTSSCTGDINNDGMWDIILGSTGSRAVLFTQYQGPYEHNFEFNESFGGIYNLWSNGVNFADFDDDGDFELISPGQRMDLMGMTGWWNIYQNLGSADSAWFETPAIFMNAGWVEEYGYYGTFEDLDNDGDYDAIYSYLRLSNEPFANCRINPGQTPWEYSDSLLPENNDIFRFPELSDIDNDGDNDLLVINSLTNELNFYENNGTPEYPEWQYNPNWISGLDVIDRRGRFADLNRDGKCDLTIFTNDGLTLYLNTGSGANPYWERVDGFSDIPTFSSTFDFVDYNGDGKQDIAFASGGKVVFYRNDTIVDVDEEYTKPKETSLRMSNFPNPFNSSTTIRFNIPNQSKVSIEIYDILGRKVDTVCKGLFVSGNHKVIWEAEDFSSGIYFYRLSTNEESAASKMILIK